MFIWLAWPGDVHIILWRVYKPLYFVFSFVGPLMQSLNKNQLEKNLHNQSCHYATLEDSLVKVLAPI